MPVLNATSGGESPRMSNDFDEKNDKMGQTPSGASPDRSRHLDPDGRESGSHVVQRQSILGDLPTFLQVAEPGTLQLQKGCPRQHEACL